MRILIVVPDAILGTILKLVVASETNHVRVLSIEKAGGGAIDWTSAEEKSMTLPEAIDEAQLIIISHPDPDIAVEIRERSGNKTLLGVFTESPIPFSSMSLDLFQELWSEIAQAFQAKLTKGS